MVQTSRWSLAGAGAFVTVVALLLASGACSMSKNRPLAVVERVDLQRYTGRWHEIAHLPNSFQKDCYATTATYSLRADGDISVLNECRKGSVEGEPDRAEGKAWVVDTTTNAKLKVQFFWPFRGNYWILELGEAYDYAVIGEPGRQYWWLLARQPKLDQALVDSILERARASGFATDRLLWTEHAAGEPAP